MAKRKYHTEEERKAARKLSRQKSDAILREKNPQYWKEWRCNNTEVRRNSRYKVNYGITIEDYNRMFAEQNGKCAVCDTHQLDAVLDVDHCHTTGKVRGLLCGHCNKALGLLKDKQEILIKAIQYLNERN